MTPSKPPGTYEIHLVSDSTGETLESIAKATLVQFNGIDINKHFWPMIRNARQMNRVMQDIAEHPGLVMYTLVDKDIRAVLEEQCEQLGLPVLPVLDPVINLLGSYLGREATALPGRQHALNQDYFARIDALHFTMAHDDGQLSHDLSDANIILVGVSRTSKTPTSIYLANKGYKTANVPFVPDCPMPPQLQGINNQFVLGLMTSPDRLVEIRTNRLRSLKEDDTTSYTALDKIHEEVKQCRRYCAENGWPVIDVTRRSIEETAAAIINKYQTWTDAQARTDSNNAG